MAARASKARPRAAARAAVDDAPAALEPILPWHRPALDALLARVAGGRAPHALLVAGPAGTGKRRFALALAAAAGCEQQANGAAPCGECRACRRFVAASPDHRTLEPEPDKRQIPVDQVRELVDFLGLTSQGGSPKTAVIQPAEALHRSAANSLLKTLEEPAGRALLILVSHAPSRMMATIRSRCERATLPSPTTAEGRQWLSAALAASGQAAPDTVDPERLLGLAAGSVLDAWKLAQGGGLDARKAVVDGLIALHAGRASPGDVAAIWERIGIDEVLRWLPQVGLAIYRERLSMGQGPGEPGARTNALRTLAGSLNLAAFDSATARIDELRALRGRASTVNTLLALESVTQGLRVALQGSNAP